MTLGDTSAQTPQGFKNWYYKVIQLQGASIFHIHISYFTSTFVYLFIFVRLYVLTLS